MEIRKYGKLAMTCAKYQVYLSGYGNITPLKPILQMVTEPALCETLCQSNSPTHELQAALLQPLWKQPHTFTIELCSMVQWPVPSLKINGRTV